jgi:hypothetical protein
MLKGNINEIFKEDKFEDCFRWIVGGFLCWAGNGGELAGGEGDKCSAGVL